MIPYSQPVRVWFEVSAQPVARGQEFLFSFVTRSLAEEVVVAQAPLRDRDGIVLQADLSVVIEHWNASGIVMATVIRFLAEQHVVFAKLMNARVRICLRSLVPEGELALPGN